jgi:cytoskeletal protein RodZ
MSTNENQNVALEESLALNKITIDLLNQKKKEHLRLWIIIVVMAIINLIETGMFIWYESQFETTSTTTTETEIVEQDTGEGNGNNIYQSGENAQYNESGD